MAHLSKKCESYCLCTLSSFIHTLSVAFEFLSFIGKEILYFNTTYSAIFVFCQISMFILRGAVNIVLFAAYLSPPPVELHLLVGTVYREDFGIFVRIRQAVVGFSQ